jgi:hypothetical protein
VRPRVAAKRRQSLRRATARCVLCVCRSECVATGAGGRGAGVVKVRTPTPEPSRQKPVWPERPHQSRKRVEYGRDTADGACEVTCVYKYASDGVEVYGRAVPGITIRDNVNNGNMRLEHHTHSCALCGAGEANMNTLWLPTTTSGRCAVTDRDINLRRQQVIELS